MKLNPTSQSLIRRAPQVAALFVVVLAVQVACSDAPSTPSTLPAGTSGTTTGGTPATTAGTTGVVPTAGTAAGTTAAAGTFATGGAAGTFGTAGTDTGGTTAGTATAGTATGGTTAGTGTAGTGGVIVAMPYCTGKALSALPFPVNMGWQPSGWSAGGVGSPISVATDVTGAQDACVTASRPPGAAAVSDCSKWHYTPVAAPTDAWVIWSYMWDAQFTHPGVCLADGAKAISFCARGLVGGEKIQVGGGGTVDAALPPLTTEWKPYSVTLPADYNGFDNGVPTGFDWKVVSTDNTGVVTFFFDKLQFTAAPPPADYCGAASGEGGAGGAGGAGGGGGGGAGGAGAGG